MRKARRRERARQLASRLGAIFAKAWQRLIATARPAPVPAPGTTAATPVMVSPAPAPEPIVEALLAPVNVVAGENIDIDIPAVAHAPARRQPARPRARIHVTPPRTRRPALSPSRRKGAEIPVAGV